MKNIYFSGINKYAAKVKKNLYFVLLFHIQPYCVLPLMLIHSICLFKSPYLEEGDFNSRRDYFIF